MRKILLLLGAAVLLLAAVVLARTARYRPDRPAVERAPRIAVPESAAERLAGSIRFATISHEDPSAFDAEAFRGLHAYLAAAFPRVRSHLRRGLPPGAHGPPRLRPRRGGRREAGRAGDRRAARAPYLVVVVTDARYYAGLSRDVYRFLPLRLAARDLARMHGTDERVAVRDYEDAVRTYRRLLLNAAGG